MISLLPSLNSETRLLHFATWTQKRRDSVTPTKSPIFCCRCCCWRRSCLLLRLWCLLNHLFRFRSVQFSSDRCAFIKHVFQKCYITWRLHCSPPGVAGSAEPHDYSAPPQIAHLILSFRIIPTESFRTENEIFPKRVRALFASI